MDNLVPGLRRGGYRSEREHTHLPIIAAASPERLADSSDGERQITRRSRTQKADVEKPHDHPNLPDYTGFRNAKYPYPPNQNTHLQVDHKPDLDFLVFNRASNWNIEILKRFRAKTLRNFKCTTVLDQKERTNRAINQHNPNGNCQANWHILRDAQAPHKQALDAITRFRWTRWLNITGSTIDGLLLKGKVAY